MTSRLKRKLGEIGVDPSSSKANESFCLIGTPLPPLEKSRDTGEFVPVWKQDVRDEKGRRRLHGAFTGGFSAGYFNTVGSKEGWAPSEFISSRSERAKQKEAKPEDFMDEEDLAELKDSQKLVDTTEEMDLLGGTQGEMLRRSGDNNTETDSIASVLEQSLMPAPKDSVGARILKKMGWRPGHGIGPKITWEQRKRLDAASFSTPTAEEDLQTAEHEEATKHMYPPRDTKVPVFPRKDNAHGLGYTPGMGLNDIVSGKGGDGGGLPGPNLSAGFGLGALNDAEDDDIDVYDGGVNRGSTRLAYDFDGHDEERIIMGQRNKVPVRSQTLTATAGFQPSAETFHDGRLVLPGFKLADKPIAEDDWFPLPQVPKDWVPNPRRVWENNKENLVGGVNEESIPRSTTSDHAKWKAGISADQRGSMLGETPLPSAPRSVFDYLAPKDRERLQNITTGSSPTSSEPGPTPNLTTLHISRVDPQIAKAALHGFQPFTSDPVKQARYTAYLKAQAAMEEELPIKPTVGQKLDEFNKEIADYAKSAQIFKPVSGTMANRFTSGSVVELGGKPQEGLHTPTAKGSQTPMETDEVKLEKKEESPKDHAARLGMFGPLTREVKMWQPAKLLCKRFGVKDPNPEPVVDSSSTAPGTGNSWQPAQALEGADLAVALGTDNEAAVLPRKPGGRRDLANIGLGDDETQGADTLTYQRPPKDIFKAIFASDDESSDDEVDADKGKEDDEPPTGLITNGADDEAAADGPVPGPSSDAIPPPTPSIPPPRMTGVIVEHVDMSTFKPTFVPRADREKGKHKSGDKDKDSKKEKKKKRGKGPLVSFEVEEEGVEEERRPSKKARPKGRKTVADEDDDAGLWVEKPPPEVVQVLEPTLQKFATGVQPAVNDLEGDGRPAGPPRGRKRAVDFM